MGRLQAQIGQAVMWNKLLVGLGSCCALLVGFPLWLACWISLAFGVFNPMLFLIAFITTMIAGLLTVAVVGYFIYLTYNDRMLTPEQKIIWVISLIALAPFSAPVFWYHYIWKPKGQGHLESD